MLSVRHLGISGTLFNRRFKGDHGLVVILIVFIVFSSWFLVSGICNIYLYTSVLFSNQFLLGSDVQNGSDSWMWACPCDIGCRHCQIGPPSHITPSRQYCTYFRQDASRCSAHLLAAPCLTANITPHIQRGLTISTQASIQVNRSTQGNY